MALTRCPRGDCLIRRQKGGQPKRERRGSPVEISSRIERQQLPDRARTGGQKTKGRSGVSNGNAVLPDIDGRSVIARRYRDITRAILVDQGGEDQYQAVCCCRRARRA